MKSITDAKISKNPIQVPDDSDVNALLAKREQLAREIEEIETLNLAKENPDFQRIVMDSYLSMQMIERAAIMLDAKKPDFALTFAGLRGRWLERQAITDEILAGKRRIRQRKSLLLQIAEKLESFRQKIKALTSQGK